MPLPKHLRDANVAFGFFTFMSEIADALGRAGLVAEGLAAIEQAQAVADRIEERWFVLDLLRIKGELLLMRDGSAAAATAEGLFGQALDWASGHDALSWELRAATSLARLLQGQGRSSEAIALLQPVYDRFTEGFETADLKAAKGLLDAL